jgi:rubrerythrin
MLQRAAKQFKAFGRVEAAHAKRYAEALEKVTAR